MKLKKLEIFQNKMGLKGCKWSSLEAPGTETHLSHPYWGNKNGLPAKLGRIGLEDLKNPKNPILSGFGFGFSFHLKDLDFFLGRSNPQSNPTLEALYC